MIRLTPALAFDGIVTILAAGFVACYIFRTRVRREQPAAPPADPVGDDAVAVTCDYCKGFRNRRCQCYGTCGRPRCRGEWNRIELELELAALLQLEGGHE